MKPKENQRVALTKQLIYSAFLKLMNKKAIHQISIRELCEIAGINRTTFYNHYGSQYDVLSEMADNYLEEIEDTIATADIKDREGVYSRVTLVLKYMEENLALTSMLLNNIEDKGFADRLLSLPKIKEMLQAALPDSLSEREKSAACSFALYGSYKLLQDWINESNRISPGEEAAIILNLARKVC